MQAELTEYCLVQNSAVPVTPAVQRPAQREVQSENERRDHVPPPWNSSHHRCFELACLSYYFQLHEHCNSRLNLSLLLTDPVGEMGGKAMGGTKKRGIAGFKETFSLVLHAAILSRSQILKALLIIACNVKGCVLEN
ncbi:hypothetical protein R1flu_001492 [Riccia fluitans]|uniref:Uncharacterized protein n=1 Tax=Riccia fluitans TaxID=41844 RepID=A0ABD1Y6Q9_9MARC